MTGPYLLAPTPTGITIVWETAMPVQSKVCYGSNNNFDKKLAVQCERGTPWQDNSEGICLYRAVLTDLQPDTLYNYRVELATGEVQQGTFQTLKVKPDKIHLYTISDSHAFAVHNYLTESVFASRPDFIIHAGDIPIGTGYQKETFADLWFKPGAELLKHIPVVYIDGNHDAGPYFNDYFMTAQRNTYKASPNGLHYSFGYGNVHIVMMNSNPWGLAEMNAVMSNLPVPEDTVITVKESLQWLEEELKSAAAVQARWRIVIMHHPYTDNFSHKHIAGIVERNNVNLMIGGHLHFYQKGVSINPAVGANILYITQGSAQDLAGVINYGLPQERILSEYPEIIAMGKGIYSTLDITDDKLVYKTYGIPEGETQPCVLDETTLVQEECPVLLANVRINVSPDKRTVSFAGTVQNTGKGLAAVAVKVLDNQQERIINLFGLPGRERVVTLNAGEKKEIAGTVMLHKAGKHGIQIGGVLQMVDVPEASAALQLKHMTARIGQGEAANVVFAAIEVNNPHNSRQQAGLDFYVNEAVAGTRQISLAPYETKLAEFAYRFSQGGEYQVRIGDAAGMKIQIEGAMKVTPLVKDLSGRGNHGIIRGNPQFISLPDGAVALALEHDGDYIEIPDHPSLHVRNGFTGMVWANMQHLARDGERDHNPLMVKGPAVGWGVNYLLRMVIKKIGVAAWGTCHGITEYAWDGGKVPVGQWAQYTSGFDRTGGGTSYINNEKVAEIAGIGMKAELRCWEGYPLFIGYAGMGHVIKELKRPKYFTHFPGQVSQIRFYAAKLSAEENKYVNDHPGELGPKAEELLVWLNFKDIETKGAHTTEWRRPAHFIPDYRADKRLWNFTTLTVNAHIPGAASITAIVEVSDDQETIKSSKQVLLADGETSFSLADLPQAQFLRIISCFCAASGSGTMEIPELNWYKVTARLEKEVVQLSWGTRAEWEQGSFAGAVGFEPLNRTKVIEEYTDVIH
ncbi:metallophosphoesterase [Anaerospora sp.]|uniref:metallophosphoesterase n=1 Tax=Anaerospora sp. TaxID=1960278 RepID=UPI00289DF0B8|nr:metallophosphoesterase [Anaerospora sp.]